MPLLARAWLTMARTRRRIAGLSHRVGPGSPESAREDLVRRYAPGRSFADIGCIWSVDGAIAFLAEQSGATAVTGLDLMPASRAFQSEHARRSSRVRFVCGDLHDEQVLATVGSHEVVWCSGVLYHAPNPLLTLKRLRAITGGMLILATETIPEVPGIAQACVFLPCLPEGDRVAHAAARPGVYAAGLSERFDQTQSYGAWWWGLSRSAVRGMLRASGFEPVEEYGDRLHATFVAELA